MPLKSKFKPQTNMVRQLLKQIWYVSYSNKHGTSATQTNMVRQLLKPIWYVC
jgi:hypothetical protein